MNNSTLGSKFERKICEDLFERGWYVINIPRNHTGQQPVDILAMKRDRVIFADCKVCSGRGFEFERIEENQRQSMRLVDGRTRNLPVFILQLPEGDIWVIYHCVFDNLERQNFKRMLNWQIREYGIPWEEYLEDMENDD